MRRPVGDRVGIGDLAGQHRTLHEARQRLADMLIFTGPRPPPATADIVAFHRAESVDHYEGTTSDIFARVNAGAPGRTVTAQPLTGSGTGVKAVAANGER
jgi:hypothetical protein